MIFRVLVVLTVVNAFGFPIITSERRVFLHREAGKTRQPLPTMIFALTHELTAGQTIAQHVYGKDNRLLMKKGFAITLSSIALLMELNVPAVYIEQEGTEDILPQDVVAPESRIKCQNALERAFAGMQGNSSDPKRSLINPMPVEIATREMVATILDAQKPVSAMLDLRSENDALFQHSVNSSVLATMVAKEMKLPEDTIRQLAMGMVFHDLGQTLQPREVYAKKGELTEEEWTVVREHPKVGFRRAMQDDLLSPLSAYVVLRHHERVDGKGYPDGLSGSDFKVIARIAAVVEVYDSLISLRPYAKQLMPDHAVRQVMCETGTAFDRQAVIALVKSVAVYPTGCAVRLNTGESGLVVSTEHGKTTRPFVRLFYNPDGSRKTPEDVRLDRSDGRCIVLSDMSMEKIRRAKVNLPELSLADELDKLAA